tara:strand:- start:716 stop:1189 length:474 start_codon:yes stop_codon:yes gene_type:complete
MNNIDKFFLELMKKHEGFRSNYYYCTAKKKTIGYGRNVDDNPFTQEELDFLRCKNPDKLVITKAQAEQILINDMAKVHKKLIKKIPFYEGKPKDIQHILTNMAFNMGTNGLLKFVNTLKLIKYSEYKTASVEMLDSRWAKQVGNRAKELSNILSKIN